MKTNEPVETSEATDPIRVLLIDDDRAFYSWVVPYLDTHGFLVVGIAETREEAECLIQTKEFDIALVDIELVELDTQGFSLVPTIRQERPKAKIAFFSSYLDPESDLVQRARSPELSVDGVLRKFMQPDDVCEALRTIVRNEGVVWIEPTLRRASPNLAAQKMTVIELSFLRDYARRPLERKIYASVHKINVRVFDNRMASIKRKILEYDVWRSGGSQDELSNLEVYEWARRHGLHFDLKDIRLHIRPILEVMDRIGAVCELRIDARGD